MLCFTKHFRYIPDSESLQKVKYVYEISRRWLPSLGVVDFPRKVFLVQLYYINEWRQLVGKQVWSLHLQSTSKCYQGPQQILEFSEPSSGKFPFALFL